MVAAVDSRPAWRAAGGEWWPIGVGLLALYVPLFYDLAQTLWQDDNYSHGPVIVVVLLWLIWDKRQTLIDTSTQSKSAAGILLLCCGLMLYVGGQILSISLLGAASLIPMLAGVLLALRGWTALRSYWFMLLFVFYLIPLPGTIIWELTGGLKQLVSQITELILYQVGYPIARSGVTLTIGPYQLVIGTACSGIHSMFSLSAVGLLYLYVVRRRSFFHNALIVASLLPIAFCANVVRVLFLVLLTYYFGDEVGQGFLHKFSGMLIFVVALLLIFFLDNVLARFIKPHNATA